MSKYDFAGWVTKNDIRCSDGVVIKHNAFKDNDQTKVPLVWNHDQSQASNVLGHVILHNKDKGVYGYGHFNDSEEAQNAKELVQHGDITSMSIRAGGIKKQGNDVVHGKIQEVSLVLAAANPGALIEHVMSHSDSSDDEAVIYTGTLIHSADDIIKHDDEEEDDVADDNNQSGKTIGEILESLTEEQEQAVQALVGAAIQVDELDSDDSDDSDDDTAKHSEGSELKHKGDKGEMKHNVFNGAASGGTSVLSPQDLNGILQHAKDNGTTLKSAMEQNDQVIEHGITNIEYLFPEVHNLDKEPQVYRDPNTNYKKILDATTKTPFSRIRTTVADFTEDEARARGYIKGKEKLEQIFPIMKRETTPQTVYKKQKLDRDDIVDITDFDVVRFIQKEMRFMLEEELGRAILVGDGRNTTDDSKIREDRIRPVISDDNFYTLKKTYVEAEDFIESVIKGMADYRGSGSPKLYIDPALLADVKLLKGTDGRWLGGSIPSDATLATMLGVSEIVSTTFMAGRGALVVNLRDYRIGSTKGGEITNFDDFDIDFNQYKYLTETRLCGALVMPHAAIHFGEQTADNGDSGSAE